MPSKKSTVGTTLLIVLGVVGLFSCVCCSGAGVWAYLDLYPRMQEAAKRQVDQKAKEFAQTPFLEQSKPLPPNLEWHREVAAKKEGKIKIRVECQPPFSVTVANGRAYQAIKTNAKPAHADILSGPLDSANPSLETVVMLPSGSSWIIIQNRSKGESSVRLQCFAVLE